LRSIQIKGLKYVDPEIIKPLIPFGKGAIVTRDELINTIRDLYKLGYFKDIETYIHQTENGIDLIFLFKELPVVQRIEFKGNEEIDDETILKALGISTKQRMESGVILPFMTIGPELAEKLASIKRGLGRVFSIDEIERMKLIIKKLYEKEGYYNVKVDYYFKGNTLVFDIKEGSPAYVAKIIIKGNKHIDTDEILDVMKTKERCVWKLRFHPPLEKDVLLDDIERIRELYIDKGYLDVEISKPKIELKNGEEYYITINIKEGRRYKLVGLDIKGNDLFTRQELFEDLKEVPKINDYYNGKAIKELKKNILKKYTDLGFIFTRVYIQKIVDRKNATVKVKYLINKDKRFYVDLINISGNYESKDSTIRRELRFSPGDLFVRDKIKKSQSRIFRLGFYNGINFNPVFKGGNLMDVDVKVSERFTGQLSLGVGYSQFTGFSVFGSVRKGNFRGTGDTLSASISIGTRYKNNQIGYIHKWAFYKPVDLGFSLYQRSADYYSFTSERIGFHVTASYNFNDIWTTGVTVGIDRVKYKDIQDYASTIIKEQEGSYTIPSIAWYINRYTVDNRLLPTEGMDSTLTLKTGFGSRGFYKYIISHAMFFKDKIFHTDWVFSFKVRYGEVIPKKDKVPLDELFFVGGDFTIRGFDYGMAGPYDTNYDPLGAKKEIIFNYQLSHPIAEKFLWGYVFVDQGKGFNSGNPLNDMYYSVGGGIKIVTPIAPIDIYYGKVQNPPPGVGSSRLGFILGTFF
jgi:outer membrane protein insertion porin family